MVPGCLENPKPAQNGARLLQKGARLFGKLLISFRLERAKSKAVPKNERAAFCERNTMKIGIALGGGGAKGFAHIGVLQELAEAGIEFDVVTGTSAGSLVGAAYCCGKLETFGEKAKSITLTDIPSLLSPSWSLHGLFSGKNAIEFLSDVLTADTIEALPKTFGATSVDLIGSELIEFVSGDLRSALRASISIPGLFTPVFKDGRTLVDGGLIEVLPVHLARKLGATFLVAVDLYGSNAPSPVALSSPKKPNGILNAMSYISQKVLRREADRMNLIQVVEATFSTLQKHCTELRLRENPADLLIRPAVSKVGVLDFHRAEPVIEIGRIAAKEILPQLKKALEDLGKDS